MCGPGHSSGAHAVAALEPLHDVVDAGSQRADIVGIDDVSALTACVDYVVDRL